MFKECLIFFLVFSLALNAQQRGNKKVATLHQISPKDVVQSVFIEAEIVTKINEFWYNIVDKNNQAMGYAMNSMNSCNEVIGHCNTTPVLIITDKNWIIQKVSLLSHYESIGYVRRLEIQGYFNLWVGKSLPEAKLVKMDAYTGATKTAEAIYKNVNYLLENGSKVLPKK